MITGGVQGQEVQRARRESRWSQTDAKMRGRSWKVPICISQWSILLKKLFGNNSQESVVGPYYPKQGRQH